jgi:hypothetical protein
MRKRTFDLVDMLMESHGLYEEDEIIGAEDEEIGAGTPEVDVDDDDFTGGEETIADWYSYKGDYGMSRYLYEDDDIDGISDDEILDDNEKTDVELAKEGGGQSPPAELKELARHLRRSARHLYEDANEAEKKAEEAEEEAEEADEAGDDDKKEELEEIARYYYIRSRKLREEAEETSEKADEIEDDAEKVKEDEKEEENKEAVEEWVSSIAYANYYLNEEDEPVGVGTPSDEVDLDDFDDDDDEDMRSSAAAPTGGDDEYLDD